MERINLLAVILVTSTVSGGSNLVFRYPPNPRPAERLSRPVYGKKGVQDGGFSLTQRNEKSAAGAGLETGLSQEAEWQYRRESGEAYDSDDSLDDQLENALWQPLHVTGGEVEPIRQRRQAPRRPGRSDGDGGVAPLPLGMAGGTTSQVTQTDSSASGNSTYSAMDWENILGYDRDFLNSLLTPSRSSCNKRFELVIDNIAFIGHPVCADENGKWSLPYEDDDQEKEPERGRGREVDRPASRNMRRFGQTPQELTPVTEGVPSDSVSERSVATTYKSEEEAEPTASTDQPSERSQSQLSFFHLVLALDKPDPQLDYDMPGVIYELLYREVAFKWTAAAFAEQVRCDWVGQECTKMSKIREHSIQQLVPLKKAQAEAFQASPLAKNLRELYDGVRAMAPVQLTVGEIPIDVAMPVSQPRVAEEWTRWDADSDPSEASSSDSGLDLLDGEEADSDLEDDEVIVRPALRSDPAFDFKPWKTLLPLEMIHSLREAPADLDDEALQRYQQISENPAEVPDFIRRFLQNLDPTVPLYEIAAYLEMDMHTEVYPLARYLIHIRKVKLIDVVRKSLRNVFMPESTIGKSIPIICAEWAKEFPSLPSWPSFISQISASPQPYRKLIPQTTGEIALADREEYTRALYWLISHGLVIQAHEHVKIVATKETKEKARRELQDDRRLKLLAKEGRARKRISLPESLAGARPRATEDLGQFSDESLLNSPDLSEEDFDETEAREDFLDDSQESFIHRPDKPSSAEDRCLRIIMRDKDTERQRRFAQCLTCFDGRLPMDAIQYETGLRRNHIRDLLTAFKEDLVVFLHP